MSDVLQKDKNEIDGILEKFGVTKHTDNAGPIRRAAIACVALNTCPLALAEAQRYLPSLITKIEGLQAKHNLQEEPISVRMTGCPNGCGRPYAAEIGFIGTSMGHYNLYLGGDRLGTRLNKKYKDSLDEEAILKELDQLFGSYSANRKKGEPFGDFTIRTQLVN